ncbi:MAG TPA: hypothetical protein VGO67_01025 [Verrucomicrobiae bacterium]|jgi:hypothetical protein
MSLIELLLKGLYVLGGAASFLLTVTLVGIGLWKIFLSVGRFLGFHWAGVDLTEPMSQALDGLECIFLAPLAFLLFKGIWDLMRNVILKKATDIESLKRYEHSRVFWLEVKALIFGLMVAVLATDLLEKILSGTKLTYEMTISQCLIIGTLVGCSFLLERHRDGS